MQTRRQENDWLQISLLLPFWYTRIISSLSPVPPVVTITFIPRCLDKSVQIWLTCNANSRVGTIMRPGKDTRHNYVERPAAATTTKMRIPGAFYTRFEMLKITLITLNSVQLCVHSFQNRDTIRSSLPSSILCSGQNVSSAKCHGNGGFLNRTWLLPSHLKDSH